MIPIRLLYNELLKLGYNISLIELENREVLVVAEDDTVVTILWTWNGKETWEFSVERFGITSWVGNLSFSEASEKFSSEITRIAMEKRYRNA